MAAFIVLGVAAPYLVIAALFLTAPDLSNSPARAFLWPLVVVRFVAVHGTRAVFDGFAAVAREAWGIIRRG